MGEIKLTDVIAPAFYGVHWDIIDGKHTYYDLSGGRGSTKSSFVGTEIPLGMMQDAVNGIWYAVLNQNASVGSFRINYAIFYFG